MKEITDQIRKMQWFQRVKHDPVYMSKRRRQGHLFRLKNSDHIILSPEHTSWPQPGDLGFNRISP